MKMWGQMQEPLGEACVLQVYLVCSRYAPLDWLAECVVLLIEGPGVSLECLGCDLPARMIGWLELVAHARLGLGSIQWVRRV